MKKNILVLIYLVVTSGLSAGEDGGDSTPPLVASILRESLTVWPEGEAIVTRLGLPANFQLSLHYHPGDEILYVIEGEGWIHYPDKPDVRLSAGQAARIPAGQHHRGSTGPAGLSALVVRVHPVGEPERIDVSAIP